MLKIGISGGIGAGKSYIAELLVQMGYPVYSSDLRAKEIMEENEGIALKIQSIFGKKAYKGKELNRTYLAQQIFSNYHLKEMLNRIVHPAVRFDFEDWAEKQSSSVVFSESALLFETGRYKDFDYTVLVTAPLDLRINRIMKRDRISKEEVMKRIESQWDDKKKTPLASFEIENDGKKDVLQQLKIFLQAIVAEKVDS